MHQHRDLLIGLAIVALLAVAPFAVYPVFLMELLCFALFAAAFNLLLGYAGLLSFGHAMFFGLAAYVCGHLAKIGRITGGDWLPWLDLPLPPLPPEAAILAAAVVAGLLGLVVGAIAIRRQGIYFAMTTLALAEIVRFFCAQAPFTGGEDGVLAIPRGKLGAAIDLSSDRAMYYFVLAVTTAGVWLIYRTIHSPYGQVLKAIRENEPRAISLGYDVSRYKLFAFVLSAALAGVAGATKALVVTHATLPDVAWQMSGEVVLMTLLGGMGTVLGPLVGAAVIACMQYYLKTWGEWVLVVQGAIFVITVLVFRRGIVGELAGLLGRSKALAKIA
jgi:branched-chain amino acid transport system permease protein